MPPIIQITKLTKCYGPTVAVGGLSLEVQAGEVFGLLGPNGAGKSTTLGMLSGLVQPTSGSVAVFGKNLRRHFLQVIARMGVMVERPAFYGNLSARRNLILLAQLARRSVTVDRALDRVGLLAYRHHRVSSFSSGMKQRLGLAQALLTEPELLILDEPTNGLDPEATQEILRLLRTLSVEGRVTIVFSSHLLHEVEVVCDRVAVLNQGNLVACETIDSVLSYDPSCVEVLIDSPESAARRLKEEDWVQSVELKRGRLYVVLADANPHRLNTFLIAQGYRITGLTPRRRTLQDYFLKVLSK